MWDFNYVILSYSISLFKNPKQAFLTVCLAHKSPSVGTRAPSVSAAGEAWFHQADPHLTLRRSAQCTAALSGASLLGELTTAAAPPSWASVSVPLVSASDESNRCWI